MNKNKKLIFRLAALAVVIGIAAAMFVVGRGHTVYFDNKSGEYNGASYDAPYQVDVIVDGKKVAKLKKGERGMADTMGQSFQMQLLITKEKAGETSRINVGLPLPYSLDGIIINLPALLQGLPAEAYMEEFVPIPSAEETADEEITTDETEGLMDFGE
ncbi:MAG: hypothetical protein IJU50_08405 [Lachnospiraceae bacterium]|nr:hypothetical protein [Lachnospiraceae bacterium]